MRKCEFIFMSYHKTEILSYNVKVPKGSRPFWYVAKFKYFVIITTEKIMGMKKLKVDSV